MVKCICQAIIHEMFPIFVDTVAILIGWYIYGWLPIISNSKFSLSYRHPLPSPICFNPSWRQCADHRLDQVERPQECQPVVVAVFAFASPRF